MKKYFAYILYSAKLNKYYVGQTYNLKIRELRHKLGLTKFTKQADDWIVVYQEVFASRSEAIRRERNIKQQKSRKFIEKLIAGT